MIRNWCFHDEGNLPQLSFPLSFSPSSRTALILATPAVTLSPARRPAGATATAINGLKWERAEAPVETRVSRSPTAWAEGATSRGRLPTAALTPALTEPLTTHTPTLIMAAPPPCWLLAEAGRAGTWQRLRGTAPQRGAAGCWRGLRLQPSPRALQPKGVWRGRAEAHLLTSSLETAAPTVWMKLEHTPGMCECSSECLWEEEFVYRCIIWSRIQLNV